MQLHVRIHVYPYNQQPLLKKQEWRILGHKQQKLSKIHKMRNAEKWMWLNNGSKGLHFWVLGYLCFIDFHCYLDAHDGSSCKQAPLMDESELGGKS